MVWIHGGGFLNGSSDIYDARWLATRGDIVVVTVNYRLGALGFLAHPALGGRRRHRQLRTGRPAGRAALGARQHRRVRRRPGQGDHRRGVGRRDVGVRPPGRPGVRRTVPGGDHAERAVPGPGRPADRASGSASTTRPSAGCADPATARTLPAATCRADRLQDGRRLRADRRQRAHRTGHRNPAAAGARPRWPPSRGATARVPVLIGSTADEFTLFVAMSVPQTRRACRPIAPC